MPTILDPDPRTATQKAYETLKQLVMDNKLKPSASYLEAELAEMLGVSRTPVREAMLQLAREGLVEVRPRHGMRIIPLSANDMAEIYEVLTELESLAAERIASRRMLPEEISQLEDCVERMEDALRADDLVAWAHADGEFHNLLVQLSGNTRLEKTVNIFADQVYRARMTTLWMREKPDASNKDHRALLEALKAGDAKAAREIHYNHRRNAGNNLVALIEKRQLDNL